MTLDVLAIYVESGGRLNYVLFECFTLETLAGYYDAFHIHRKNYSNDTVITVTFFNGNVHHT